MKQNEIPLGYTRVSSILQPYSTLSEIDPNVVAKAADRGTRVHAHCENYALGLFLTEIEDDCKNYVNFFIDWFDNMVASLLFTEQRMNCPNRKISGQFDMIAVLKGDRYPTLIDIKTPASPSLSWQLQTAAYRMMAKEILSVECTRRICLMLPKVGSMGKIVEYENHKKDEDLFLKALELYRFFER
ncbi:MAG: hypothetical protein C5B43_01290 [Verrucomicrobia bacterium]|nr:MAG: hypothetical protein C5B43_01290 [Verrucomicrobiota bacterium]